MKISPKKVFTISKIYSPVSAAAVAVFKLRAACPTQEAVFPKKLEMLPLGWKSCHEFKTRNSRGRNRGANSCEKKYIFT